jgi:transcriptional regulator with XRE-family HTH domain
MGISQRKLCKLLRIDETQFSRWLGGKCNFSAEVTLKIFQLLNLSKRDLELKFGNAHRISAKIMSLQESGKAMKLDDSDTSSITDPDSDDSDDPDDIDFLKSQLGLYRSAIRQIKNYLNRPTKAKPNAGATEGPRTVNTSPKAGGGPRGDEYPS